MNLKKIRIFLMLGGLVATSLIGYNAYAGVEDPEAICASYCVANPNYVCYVVTPGITYKCLGRDSRN